jgi:hypothetical protein
MDPVELFAILALSAGGFMLVGYTISKISSLIKFRMERKYSVSTEDTQQLLHHLKDMQAWRIKAEKRIQTLEQIVTDEDALQQLSAFKQPLLNKDVDIDGESQSGTVPNQLRNRS